MTDYRTILERDLERSRVQLGSRSTTSLPTRPQAPEPAHRGGCRWDRGLRRGDLDRDVRGSLDRTETSVIPGSRTGPTLRRPDDAEWNGLAAPEGAVPVHRWKERSSPVRQERLVPRAWSWCTPMGE